MAQLPEKLARLVRLEIRALVLMDLAGGQINQSLPIETNLTSIFLPSYSPELNAIERFWVRLRKRFLSCCFFAEDSIKLS